MVIGILRIDLYLYNARSLKEKRMVLKSLKTRTRNNFNVAVTELDFHDKWQRSSLAFVSACIEKKALDRMFADIVHFIEGQGTVEIVSYSTEFL